MKYQRIKISNFIPMLHCGTKSIIIDLITNTLIIIGTNGCGKTRFLNELVPYPANRSDYEKNGFKELTISHNGSTFVLTSDFSKPGKAHSFLKDGEELNTSGASTTQTDLCNQHFNYSPVVNSLSNLDYHICDMSRTDRKFLFMTIYPQSLGFVLDYHKRVSSRLRDFAVNIKTFNGRRISLEEKRLSDSELTRIRSLHELYQSLNNDLDQKIYSLYQRIDTLKSLPDFKAGGGEMWEESGLGDLEWLQSVDKMVTQSLHDLAALKKENPSWLFKGSESDKCITKSKLECKESSLRELLTERTSEVTTLKDQLEQYEQTKGIDLEKEIELLRTKIENLKVLQQKALSVFEGKQFPKLASTDDLYQMNQGCIAKIRYLLGEIFQSNSIWTPCHVESEKQRIWSLKMELDHSHKQIEFLESQIKELSKQASITGKIDPNCTSSMCHLKEVIEKRIEEAKEKIDIASNQLNHEKQREKHLSQIIATGEKELLEPLAVNPFVTNLLETIQGSGIADYICGGTWNIDQLIGMMNENPSKVWDQLASFVTYNEHYLQYKTYTQDLKVSQQELDTLIKIHLPANKLIVSTITEKQLRYKKCLEEIKTLYVSIKNCSKLNTASFAVIDKEHLLSYIVDNLIKFKKWFEIKFQIDRAKEYIHFFETGKNKVQTSLLEVKTILNEQTSIITRLDQEILPNLKQFETAYKQWSIVEQGLSPNGIPHDYIVDFINILIAFTNKIIKRVWVYDMEILPLNKDTDLSYDLSFTVNNGSPIKDIGTASTGQKEIIDLAFVLAVFHQLQLGKQYPLKLDEPDGGLINEHRIHLLNFLTEMMKNEDLSQMFMVNHFPSVYDSFIDSQTLCIKEEGILLPAEYNQEVTFEKC